MIDRRRWLEELEQSVAAGDVDPSAALAFIAAQDLSLDKAELNAARRRALFVLAAGGDPHRQLEPGNRAIATLAADIDRPALRARLASALDALSTSAHGLPSVEQALAGLRGDAELALRWLALALLAEELAEEEPW